MLDLSSRKPIKKRIRLHLEILEGRLAPAASQLAFETAVPTLSAGQPIPDIRVDVQDSTGQLDAASSASVTIGVAGPGDFVAGGSTTVSAVNGIATFSGLSLLKAGAYTFTAAASGLTPAVQNNVTVNPGAPSLLVLDPAARLSATAGQPISAFNVFVHDAFDNLTTSGSVQVSAAVNGPAPFSAGSTTVASTNGVAAFSGLVLSKAGTYTLTLSAPGLTDATFAPLIVNEATPNHLAFGSAPSTTSAGQAIAPFTVNVQDANGNPISGAVVSIRASGPGNFTSGVPSAVSDNGVATFSGLVLKRAGSYTFTATLLSGVQVTSPSFTIQPAAASQLAVTIGPLGVNAGVALRTLSVAIEDAYGNVVTTSTAPVTLSANGPGSLSGTTTVNAVRGVATFRGLVLSIPGSYTLTASAIGLKSGFSRTFTIVPVPAQLQFFGVPATARVGKSLPLIQVQVYDILGRPLQRANISVTLRLPNASGLLTQRTDARGVASFTGLVVRRAGAYVATATVSGVPQAVSRVIRVVVTPSALRFSTQPRNLIGRRLPAIKVQLVDVYGHAVSQAGVQVSLRLITGRLDGVLTRRTDRHGVATFTGLVASARGRYVLRAAARGLGGALSARFTVLS